MSHADDCETLMKILIDAGPTTLDQAIAATGWTHRKTNETLLDLRLRGMIGVASSRVKGRKIVTYEVKPGR